MDKRLKRVILVLLVVLFLLGCPSAIFYSQGYRFDFETGRITKTGGLFFKILPKQCDIYVDGKFIKKTSLIFGTAFISDILPKSHFIEIQKEGYLSWKKNLEVKAGLVTEVKKVILFPKEISFSPIFSDVNNFFFSPDAKKAILEETKKDKWSLFLWETKNHSQKPLLKESDLVEKLFDKETKIELLSIIWGPNHQKIILKTKTHNKNKKAKIKYFLLDTSELEKPFSSLSFLDEAQQISFNPNNNGEIFWIEPDKKENHNNLFKGSLSEKQTPTFLLKEVLAYKVQNSNIYWLSNNGFLYQSDFSGHIQKIINTTPLETKNDSQYRIMIVNNNYFIKKDRSLYYLNNSSGNFEKISDSIEDLIISPQKRKIALINDHEITIFFLQDNQEQPERKKGENVFISRFSKKINQLFWLNPDYLILSVGNEIKISEIDNRDHINIFVIKDFQGFPKIFFDRENNQIYALSNQKLLVSQSLLSI